MSFCSCVAETDLNDYLTPHPETTTLYEKIFIGFQSFPLQYFSSTVPTILSISILKQFGYQFDLVSRLRDQFAILISPDPIVRITAIFYVTILGPLIEEFTFREILQSQIFTRLQNASSTATQKIMRIFGNAVIFGLSHTQNGLGLYNIPIVINTIIAGAFYAYLRETTGDIASSFTAHAMNNSLFTLSMYFQA